MNKTSIEWTDYSWPIANGCRRVSPGCVNCYAERLISTRLSKTEKYKGLAIFGEHGPRWTGESRMWMKDLAAPLRLRKPSKIFVADMGDLFYEEVSNEEIAAVFGVMAAASRHTFQVLTKRPKRMREWFDWATRDSESLRQKYPNERTSVLINERLNLRALQHIDMPTDYAFQWPLPNVWLGVSAEDQQRADERIPQLLDTPAAVRFVSYEPALGPIRLQDAWIREGWSYAAPKSCAPGLDWIIVGGESGPGARPFDIAWARSIRDQCKSAGTTAYFCKQLGRNPHDSRLSLGCGWQPDDPEPDTRIRLKDSHGGDMSEWPEDLRVRQFPRSP